MEKATPAFFKHPAILLLSALLLVNDADSHSRLKKTKKQRVNEEAASFMELVDKNYAFVDKTLFIKDFLEAKLVPYQKNNDDINSTKVMRVCYPRKWGKTMNMKMIEDFLQMEVDELGNQINPKETAAYRLFALGKTASGHDVRLNIAIFRDIIDKYAAQYPVIYVSFKHVKGSTYDEIVTGVKLAVAETFKKHAYMTEVFKYALQNVSTNKEVRKKARENLARFRAILSSTRDEDDLTYSLGFLSAVLHQHFGKKVYLLIDDHDQPIMSLATQKAPNLNALERIRKFLLQFLAHSHYDWFVNQSEKSLINGIVRVAHLKEYGRWSDINYFAEFSILGDKFSSYYGFTQAEVGVLFAQCRIDPKLAGDAEKWYKGYSLREAPVVYNPLDVLKFARHGVISNYWVKSGSLPFAPYIFRNALVKTAFFSLLSEESVTVELDDLGCTSKQLYELATALNPAISVLSGPLPIAYKANMYYDCLLMTGYLTLDKTTDSLMMAHVRIPNEEIALEIAGVMIQHYEDAYSINPSVQKQLEEQVKRLPKVNNTVTFKRALKVFFSAFPKFCGKTNSNVLNDEDVVNSAFNMLTLITKRIYNFNSKIYPVKSGGSDLKPRPNIVVTLEEKKVGIIIQLTFNISAEKALAQAEEHAKMLHGHKSILNTRLIGINVFPNQTVEIRELWTKNSK